MNKQVYVLEDGEYIKTPKGFERLKTEKEATEPTKEKRSTKKKEKEKEKKTK